MSFTERCSGSSSKRQENGDMFSESERPLKKARFAWQVKGKYHLKNGSNEDLSPNKTPSINETTAFVPDSSNEPQKRNESTQSNVETLGNYILTQDFNTLDSVIIDSEKSILKPCKDVSVENINYPRYIPSYNNGMNVPSESTGSSTSSSRSITTTELIKHDPIITEDMCIARWQARQKAIVYIDNTINRVLDITSGPWIEPLPAHINRYLTQDFAEFINNLPGANSVEDEGILMAISAHGLQNASSSSTNENEVCERESEINRSLPKKDLALLDNSFSSNTDMFGTSSDKEKFSEKDSKYEVSPDRKLSHSNKENYQSTRELPNEQILFSDSMSKLSSDNNVTQDSSEHYYPDVDVDDDIGLQNDLLITHDFMDAAVSFAIQNIGLTSYSTNCG